MTRQQK